MLSLSSHNRYRTPWAQQEELRDRQIEPSVLLDPTQIFMFCKYTINAHGQQREQTLQAKQLIQGVQGRV